MHQQVLNRKGSEFTFVPYYKIVLPDTTKLNVKFGCLHMVLMGIRLVWQEHKINIPKITAEVVNRNTRNGDIYGVFQIK